MGKKNRLRICLLVLYAILLIWSTYRATINVIEHNQCIEDDYGPWQRVLMWLELVENTPKCPSISTVIMRTGWDFLFLLAVGAAGKAGSIIGNIFTANQNVSREEREPTEKLYLMRRMLRGREEVIVLRITKTKEEYLHYNQQTRRFREIMVLPRRTEDEYNSHIN